MAGPQGQLIIGALESLGFERQPTVDGNGVPVLMPGAPARLLIKDGIPAGTIVLVGDGGGVSFEPENENTEPPNKVDHRYI